MSPCHKCQKRHIACHDKCDDYIAWKEKMKQVYKKRIEDGDWISYQSEKVWKRTFRKGCGAK